MKVIKSYITKNRCYTNPVKNTNKGIFLHSVGCPQPKASAFINNYNRASCSVSVHAFIEPTGNVYQTLPWNYRAWHVGTSYGNSNYIAVEMTEPSTIKYTGGANWKDLDPAATKEHVMNTYKYAVELFAYLCNYYNLDPLGKNVILSHHEGNVLGIASNHGDVEHIWNRFGLTMDQFRKDVKAKMGGKATIVIANTAYIDSKNYTVKVTSDDGLNIRKGPGTNYDIIGSYKKNEVVTVYGYTSDRSWLRVKTGYISAKYTKEVDTAKVTQSDTYKATVTAERGLNVRKGPGTGYARVNVLTNGATVTVIGESNGWSKIGENKWVSSQYLKKN